MKPHSSRIRSIAALALPAIRCASISKAEMNGETALSASTAGGPYAPQRFIEPELIEVA